MFLITISLTCADQKPISDRFTLKQLLLLGVVSSFQPDMCSAKHELNESLNYWICLGLNFSGELYQNIEPCCWKLLDFILYSFYIKKKCFESALTLIGMRKGTFNPLLNFCLNFPNFLEMKIDINRVNLTPCKAHWDL